MATNAPPRQAFNVMIVAQAGRLQFEALLFAASLRLNAPGLDERLHVAIPRPGPLWDHDPGLHDNAVLSLLADFGARIVRFDNHAFGQSYPHGNKIEALLALPADEPFVFFDTDTLITGDLMSVPFDFDRPSASLRREGTWPKPVPGGPGHSAIWRALYDRFGLDFESSLDLSHPEGDWRRHLYFNAGYFYHRCPHVFGRRFLDWAVAIRDDPPSELAGQSLDPWLDQVTLPLVIHSLGGGRDSLAPGHLDGAVSCHYRTLPLLYARESDAVVDLLHRLVEVPALRAALAGSAPVQRLVVGGEGARIRAMFDRDNLPDNEQAIRKRIRQDGLWLR